VAHSPSVIETDLHPEPAMTTNNQREGLNILSLIKGDEKYIFIFDSKNISNVLRKFGQFSANKELSFSWFDAATLSERVKNLASSDDTFCEGR
jgi:hypothetical protein